MILIAVMRANFQKCLFFKDKSERGHPNRWATCVQGLQSRSLNPYGGKTSQRWTAVPRAGHRGRENRQHLGLPQGPGTHWPNTQQQTSRPLTDQRFSQGQHLFFLNWPLFLSSLLSYFKSKYWHFSCNTGFNILTPKLLKKLL